MRMLRALRTVMLLSVPLYLLGCATGYSGPGLTSVLSTTCAGKTSFTDFRACVSRSWYAGVIAQGYGTNLLVQQFNARMQLLGQAVDQKQMSDVQAIINATDLAYQLRSIESADLARQNEALQRTLSRVSSSLPQNMNQSRPRDMSSSSVSCIRFGDFSRQVFTFQGIACPPGYSPAL